MINHTQILQLLEKVWQIRPSAFAGLGVVFYVPPVVLPSIPLQGDVNAPYVTPVRGLEDIAVCLASISDLRSPWHDGFHFVDVPQVSLTHLAHYIAPPLTSRVLPTGVDRPSGARHMTALLTSCVACVEVVAVMSAAGEICLYANGQLVSKLKAQP